MRINGNIEDTSSVFSKALKKEIIESERDGYYYNDTFLGGDRVEAEVYLENRPHLLQAIKEQL